MTHPSTNAASCALTGPDLAAVLAVVVVWGLNFVVMKLGLHDFTPFQLGAGRYLLAVRPPRVRRTWVVLYGLLQGLGQFGILFLALELAMTAALASVLLQTQVFFTALFGFGLLKERAGRPLRAGMVLAALGLALLWHELFGPASGTTALGFALTLCAAAV